METLDPKAFENTDEKGFIPDETRNGIFRKLRMKSDNRSCFECTARNPTWISLSYGVYLCLECSGEHRRKGVHISFVRSVELDRFSPDQIVQMACGGNAKAWEYFKSHGMGKTCETGRPVDYNSKIAQRYKQNLDKESQERCSQLSVNFKASQLPMTKTLSDPVDEATEVAGPISPAPKAAASPAPASTPSMVSPAAPVRTNSKTTPNTPQSVVVRKTAPATPEMAAPASTTTPSPAGILSPAHTTAQKPVGGFGTKQKAKQIDFDFDFDFLEKEANKPPPVQVKSTDQLSVPPTKTVSDLPSPDVPVRARSEPNPGGKFSKAKAISSNDFFGELEGESAAGRMERESRYNKFSSSAAISSDAFFGDGDPEAMGKVGEDNLDDWKTVAGGLARASLSKGAEMITTYLNKVRD